MKNKYYFRVDLFLTSDLRPSMDQFDAIALERYSCCGIEDFSIDEERVDEILGQRAFSGGDVGEDILDEVSDNVLSQDSWRGYFFYEQHENFASEFAEYVSILYPHLLLKIQKIDVEDWNEQWRKSYVPISVSQNLMVIPQWQKEQYPESENQTMIYIYPGQGFGTGGHETTFLCLKIFSELGDVANNFSECLDLGCGSGILGIAAIKYKYKKVVFCDIDRAAMDNCVQNLVLNFENLDLSNHSVVDRTRLNTSLEYDLVFANILESALITESKLILSSLRTGGIAILSGILNHQADNIIEHFSELGFDLLTEQSKGDWTALGMIKK